jgi:hypothetical protein
MELSRNRLVKSSNSERIKSRIHPITNNLLRTDKFVEAINLVIDAHNNFPKEPQKAFRKWDARTPSSVHPVWCATTILTEYSLSPKTRIDGFYTLLYHDIIEDTTKKLPLDTNPRIKKLVSDMTFYGGNNEEMLSIWSKPKEVRLFKLYDKVSNLLDGSWMSDEKRKVYEDYTAKLCKDVESNYGTLNITVMASAIINRKRSTIK